MNGDGECRFFVLRTPLLPAETLLDWSSGLGACTAWERGEPIAAALAADRATLRDRLRVLIARPEVREAIFLASPSLDEAIAHWLQQPESERGERAERALIRYLCRMTTRPTPFGLFAGVATGAIARATQLRLAGCANCRRHTRLDNDYLFALVQKLTGDPALRSTLRYRPNDSLCAGGGRYRYVEARVEGTPPRRSHHLVSVEDTPELRATIGHAELTATRAELAEALIGDDTEAEVAAAFIDELIEAQVLVPVLALPITGPEPLPVLIRELGELPSLQPTVQVLREVEASLAAIDRAALGVDPARYREVARIVEPLPAKVELGSLFQVDLVMPGEGLTLGEAVVGEVHRGVEILHRLGRRSRTDPMKDLKAAFQERYEGREVPLLEALDEEVGLSAHLGAATDPSPLVRGMAFAGPQEENRPWGRREQHLLTLLGRAVQDGREEIVLEDSDLQRLALPDIDPLPPSYEVIATLLARSAAAVEHGDFRLLLIGAAGPPGARFLGRFCHADRELTDRVHQMLRAEEAADPEAVHAEVVHLPEGRLGNILLRPQLRSHEITYLGRSGAPEEQQIPATDLLLSLRDGEFVLRSARLNRRVVPRLTNHHNYGIGLGVYQFLGLLQGQGVASGMSWDWGPLETAPVLPRVRVGRVVLAPRLWNLAAAECRQLGSAQGEERFSRVQEWRRQRQLPRWVALTEHDNRLPVDLDNPLAIDVFVREIKSQESARLEEIWLGTDDLCVEGPEGRYSNEIVVPVVRPAEASRERSPRAQDRRPGTDSTLTSRREFPLGSEWAFIKLYCTPGLQDEILTEVIGPLTQELLTSGTATGWYFIRYADPGEHLRWRLAGSPARLRDEGLPAVTAAAARLLDAGKIWRIQFDTYQREVERYGGWAGITLAEQIFQIDSESVLELIDMLEPGDQGLDERWRLALYGAHRLLDDWAVDLSTRREQTRLWSSRWRRAARGDTGLSRLIGERFRKERPGLEALLDPTRGPDSDLAPGIAVYQERSQRLAPIIAQLHQLDRAGGLSVPIVDLVQSHVHMHLNRLLRSAQNHHEVVLYDFLARLYDARLARTPKSPVE